MIESYVKVIGIRPHSNSNVKPAGLHLRWSFPKQLGFPLKFQVYRRHSEKFEKAKSVNLKAQGNVIRPGTVIGECQFLLPESITLQDNDRPGNFSGFLINPPTARSNNASITLVFANPIVNVEIGVRGAASTQVRFFSEDRFLHQVSSSGTQQVQFSASLITRIEIQANFDLLTGITFTSHEAACGDSDWTLRRELLLPKTVNEMISRLEAGLSNRYAADKGVAESRYSSKAKDMLDWLQALQRPAASPIQFEEPTDPPDLLRFLSEPFKSTKQTQQVQRIRPQSILLFAALDPNVARMLGLYWVDQYDTPSDPNRPKADTSYDYKVIGKWKQEQRCGLLLALGGEISGLPEPSTNLAGRQLQGHHWDLQGRAFGRVGLNWTAPGPANATRPVLFDVYRDNQPLTPKSPVLAPVSQAEINPAPAYIDREVEVLEAQPVHIYEVAPIDVFGQVGDQRDKASVAVKDLPAPPAPIRLQTWQPDPKAHPHRVILQYEYGALQHLEAPNIQDFRIYRRAGSLSRSLRVQAVVSQARQSGGKREYTLLLSNPRTLEDRQLPASDLQPVVGDVLARIHAAAEKRLPARDRRQFRIASVTTGNPLTARLEPVSLDDVSALPPPGAAFDMALIADPHNKGHWVAIPNRLSSQKPISSTLARDPEETLEVGIVRVSNAPPAVDPFAALRNDPALNGVLPASLPNVAPMPAIVEVEIDRALLDPDVFVTADGEASDVLADFSYNGTVVLQGGQEYKIAYVTSGVDRDGINKRARLGLLDQPVLAPGQTITLRPRPGLLSSTAGQNDQVRCLTISGQVEREQLGNAGGEILLVATMALDQALVGQVVSAASNGARSFNLLVRFSGRQRLAGLRKDQKVAYYVPYRAVLDFDLTTDTPQRGLGLKIEDGKGTRTANLAVSACNDHNTEGPLSLPVAFTAVRSSLNGRPSRPFPCGSTVTGEAGYATPPDLQGRSTVRLCWDAGSVDPAAGIRYEVARALDSTILAVHLRNWKQGHGEAPLPSGPRFPGAISGVTRDPQSGLYQCTFAPGNPIANRGVLRNPRLAQGGAFFEVTFREAG